MCVSDLRAIKLLHQTCEQSQRSSLVLFDVFPRTPSLRYGSAIALDHSDATMATTAVNTEGAKPAATALIATSDDSRKSPKHYRGFVAGVFSGIAKLSGMGMKQAFFCCEPGLTRHSRPPIRHGKSASADDAKIAFPRPCRLSHADAAERGLRRTVQGRHSAAGRMDVHGLDVGPSPTQA